MKFFTALRTMFSRRPLGGLGLNLKMADDQAHGKLWLPNKRWGGTSAVNFRVSRPEGLEANSAKLIGALRRELQAMGIDPTTTRGVELNTRPGLILDLRT